MIFRPFLLASLFFYSTIILNAQSQVKGKLELLPGREVRLIAETDPISKTQVVLDLDTIDQDGYFELSTNLEGYQELLLSVHRFTAPLYVGENDKLEITIPNEPRFRLADSWLKGKLEYTFSQTDSNKVNAQISRFDGAYYYFFLRNSQFIGTSSMKDKIIEFQKEFDNPEGAHDFVKSYTQFSIAEMKLSGGFKKDEIYKEYLKDGEVILDNPAWSSFFNTFYADYFTEYDNRFGGAALYNRLNTGLTVDSLNILLDEDMFLEEGTIRQLVVLKSISESYSDPKYSKEPLKAILQSILESPESNDVKIVAENLSKKWKNLSEENSLTNIRDRYVTKMKIPENGKATLLITSLSGGSQLLKELSIIESLLGRYPDLFNVVELHLGLNYSSRSRAWPMFMVDKNYQYLADFEIYSIPHFMWFDSEGKLQENPTTNPSEGLEEMLYKLQSEKEQKNKIKVGEN